MTFFSEQPDEQIDSYKKLLTSVGSLSNLFSESASPYISSRAAENIFCKAFSAENLSRGDSSADARKNDIGIGIKTFLYKNGNPLEKVAEFNSDHKHFSKLPPEEQLSKIALLRNERIETTIRMFGLKDLVYHCVTRDPGVIKVYETSFSPINVSSISNINITDGSIKFKDGINSYSFNKSKSTLYKYFDINGPALLSFPVIILDDPYTALEKLNEDKGLVFAPVKQIPHVFLPLYSNGKGDNRGFKYVPERSGLNQWNANGRKRHEDELYIPIPAWIHKKFPGFFPPRDAIFNLVLPDKKIINASVCQQGSKALMSNPNSKLGEWLLRDVLRIKKGTLITYDKLLDIGLDTAVVYKIDSNTYDINFAKIGTYENFYIENGGISKLGNEEDSNEEED